MDNIRKELFETAALFKKTGCWNWMNNMDIFGVKDPISKEIAYCCITGNDDEGYGIMAYMGTEGILNFYALSSGMYDEDDPEIIHLNKGFLLSFYNRGDLLPDELMLIKDLGLKFRGKNQWPIFKNFVPGYLPKALDDSQCIFMKHILEQAMIVAEGCKYDKELIDTGDPYRIMVRTPRKAKGSEITWRNSFVELENKKRDYEVYEVLDEVLLKRLRVNAKKRIDVMEVDFFYGPFPVEQDNNFFFPVICAFANNDDGYVLGIEMVNSYEERFKFGEAFLRLIENEKIMPRRILVCKEDVFTFMEEVCKKLKIKLELVYRLTVIPELRKSMVKEIK